MIRNGCTQSSHDADASLPSLPALPIALPGARIRQCEIGIKTCGKDAMASGFGANWKEASARIIREHVHRRAAAAAARQPFSRSNLNFVETVLRFAIYHRATFGTEDGWAGMLGFLVRLELSATLECWNAALP